MDNLENNIISRAIVEASRDPLFLTDVQETERAFVYADFEFHRWFNLAD